MTCWSLIHVEVCVYLMFNCSSIRISFDLESPRTKKHCTPLIICPIKWINLMLAIMFSDSMHMISNVAQFFKWINFFILNKNYKSILIVVNYRNTDAFMLQPESSHGKKKNSPFCGKQSQRPKGQAPWVSLELTRRARIESFSWPWL
jgi:hypothetical protein